MNDRQTSIVELIRAEQEVRIHDLSKRLDVSEMTVRRDLAFLEKHGILTRTRNGGVASGKFKVLRICKPDGLAPKHKVEIGRLGAKMVEPGQTIMLDAGTTTYQVALALPQDPSITVITTSILVVQALFDSPINLILLGGIVSRNTPSMYGPITEKMLRDLHVDILYTGCDGASSRDGFYTHSIAQASLSETMISIAERVVVVTESAKFLRKSLARFAVVNQVHTVITDVDISMEDKLNMEEQEVSVLVAGRIVGGH